MRGTHQDDLKATLENVDMILIFYYDLSYIKKGWFLCHDLRHTKRYS